MSWKIKEDEFSIWVADENDYRVADVVMPVLPIDTLNKEITVEKAMEAHRERANLIAGCNEMYTCVLEVVRWAKTPGDHGGNPYCKEFVIAAEKALEKIHGIKI